MPAHDYAGHDAVLSLIDQFADLARRVHTSQDFDDSLARITRTAERAIPGCRSASISLLTDHGPPITKGATDQLARDGDQIQYEESEGPCLDAAMHERWIYTEDVAIDPRWPRSLGPPSWTQRAISAGHPAKGDRRPPPMAARTAAAPPARTAATV